ncbi:sporulation histidine kinase inhibitor Sda [Chryseomicrobium excrementi]|uniref:sporulation histidine kinase inhibitor Sda n=1 Tax=Chryseomicrobium excrementi TaxID=2041346 RepID=UPI00105457EB|nr:sporulation histidine kinase inhibitor Sda [Chryseomicrobium excrementi]
MKHSLDLTAKELLAAFTSAKRQQLDSSFIKLLRQQIYDRKIKIFLNRDPSSHSE